MYITHCNKCGKDWQDTNPGPNSKEYPDTEPVDGILATIEDDGGYFQGCPECYTDGYLVDNKQN